MCIRIKKMILLLLCAVFALSVCPVSAQAKENGRKTVRVGWFESTLSYTDKFGRRGGAAYEYQQKISAYTGWSYEYVEDSWANLFEMLTNGEIDLLSDISYTEERSKKILYPRSPMGAESYYIYIDADDKEISPVKLETLEKKRVGVNKNSYQEQLLKSWVEKNAIKIEIVELVGTEETSMSMLRNGEIDAYVSMDTFGALDSVVPVCKIGSSDYYFGINKDRPDLLDDINSAMSAILDEDPYFNQRMYDEYIHAIKTNAFLAPNIESWLKKHGNIRIGYWDDYLPFCAVDKNTGELTGALKDFLTYASNSLKNVDVGFDTVAYPDVESAVKAVKNGEIDCVFPVNLSTYDGEIKGVLTVSDIMQTEMSLLVRGDGDSEIVKGKSLTIAVDEGNSNFETFIKDKFPDWEIKIFKEPEDCFRAVSAKEADGVLACNYRMNSYESRKSGYKLIALPIGEAMKLSFAVSADSPELYSLMNKIANLSSGGDMGYTLVSYMYSDQKVSFMDFLEDNWIGVILFITAVFAAIIILLILKLRAERRVNEQQEKLKSVTKIAYTDPLTGVKSKQAYAETENLMNRRIAENEVSEFAMVLFDLNDLKKVNDTKGHESGNQYIKDACSVICDCFKRSPVYRIGGDEFVAILEGHDFDCREELLSSFRKQMESNMAEGKVSIACGCADFEPGEDYSAHSVLERADVKMYQNKDIMKKQFHGRSTI